VRSTVIVEKNEYERPKIPTVIVECFYGHRRKRTRNKSARGKSLSYIWDLSWRLLACEEFRCLRITNSSTLNCMQLSSSFQHSSFVLLYVRIPRLLPQQMSAP
jgi:hypothetical protein